ncbi:MAG: DUF4389 domain-containing protein [Natronospirillum sp.]|uniref:DUF4389 domain-containing protein n=1 Tax=Natronospirillum sp. TaxID=2812955 RepID=UPI0025FAA787|nr:DUF4389 domain-containing protein [Natronospirillum sp.]MCH8551304.1 DUF4389 domain-containing protein [Natronospirillum sp.]
MADNNRGKWEYVLFRVLYMILFWLFSRLAWVLVGIFAVVQFVFVLVRSEKQPDLLRVSGSVVQFARQCGDYLTFQSEYKPFPFNDWPASTDGDGESRT